MTIARCVMATVTTAEWFGKTVRSYHDLLNAGNSYALLFRLRILTPGRASSAQAQTTMASRHH